MQVSGGKVLWRPGDPSDSFYIVINGRLRAIDDAEEGKVKILGEYGQGDSVSLWVASYLTDVDLLASGRRAGCNHACTTYKYRSCDPRHRIS